MKSLFIALMIIAIPQVAQANNNFAPDNSGLICWAFLGMCSLIIVAQVLPAIMTLVGMMKAITIDNLQSEDI